jgi:PEP-CTERM motif
LLKKYPNSKRAGCNPFNLRINCHIKQGNGIGMKKFVFVIAGSLSISIGGFGQGTVQFRNNSATPFYVLDQPAGTTNLATSGPLGPQDGLSGSTGTIDVGLYWSTTPFTAPADGTLAGIETIGGTAGLLAGNASFGVAGTTPGEQVYVQVFAWDSSFSTPMNALAAGADFGAASAGPLTFFSFYGGIGPAQQVTLGPAAGLGTAIFGNGPSQFGATYLWLLVPVPEPATVMLGGLGAVALLLFRRQK